MLEHTGTIRMETERLVLIMRFVME